MEVLSITHNKNRMVIVLRLRGKDEESKMAELRKLKETELQEYSCDVEGNISSGFCNVIITVQNKTKEEMQKECSTLYLRLHSYLADDYGLE